MLGVFTHDKVSKHCQLGFWFSFFCLGKSVCQHWMDVKWQSVNHVWGAWKTCISFSSIDCEIGVEKATLFTVFCFSFLVTNMCSSKWATTLSVILYSFQEIKRGSYSKYNKMSELGDAFMGVYYSLWFSESLKCNQKKRKTKNWRCSSAPRLMPGPPWSGWKEGFNSNTPSTSVNTWTAQVLSIYCRTKAGLQLSHHQSATLSTELQEPPRLRWSLPNIYNHEVMA